MENQINVGDFNTQQVEQNPVSQPTQTPGKPNLNYWAISTLLLLVVFITCGILYILNLNTKNKILSDKGKSANNQTTFIPTPTPTGIEQTLENIDAIFTFESPNYPWTADEITTLKNHLRKVYPVIKEVYGNPFTSNRIKITKDPTISYGGLASPPDNITLMDVRLNTLTHELIHLFHGQAIIASSAFEEGMTRAVEIIVSRKAYGSSERNFQYSRYYDFYNRPYIGNVGGAIATNTANLDGIRYDLAAFAFYKIYVEDNEFFKNFNSLYFEQFRKDPTINSSREKIFQLIARVKKSIESKDAFKWLTSQEIFSFNPVIGKFVFNDNGLNGTQLSLISRDQYGGEQLYDKDALIATEYYDADNNLIDSYSFHTQQNCSKEDTSCNTAPGNHEINNPNKYKGMYKMKIYVDGKLSDDGTYGILDPAYNDVSYGIYGISPNMKQGKVKIGNNIGDINNGYFFIPLSEKGTYTIEVVDNPSIIKTFTKDSGSYFIILN